MMIRDSNSRIWQHCYMIRCTNMLGMLAQGILTASSIENAFVHLTRVPDATDRCLTGKENVNPSSRVFPFDKLVPFSSSATNLANSEAMKPNNSCKMENEYNQIINQRITTIQIKVVELSI